METNELEEKLQKYEDLFQTYSELQSQQEDILTEKLEESKPLIEWYREQGVRFTHPTLDYNATSAAILGFDDTSNELIVYMPDKGLRKVNIHSKDEKPTLLTSIVSEGHFETAMSGLEYLKIMLDDYSTDMENGISMLESELAKYK